MKPEKIPDIQAPGTPAPEAETRPPQGESPRAPEAKRRSWPASLLASLFRILLLLLLILALVPVAAEIALRRVPYATWKPVVEPELSRALKMPVSLDDAQLSLLRGARIEGFTLGGAEPLLKVREMVLDYDLLQLLEGRLVVNQVLVDRPMFHLHEKEGRWNFQPILEGREAGAAQPEAPAAEPAPGLPPVPLAVSLKELSIKNLRLDFEREGRERAHLDGLSLAARGNLDRDALDVALAVTMSRPPGGKAAHNLEYSSSLGKGTHVRTLALADLGVTTGDLNRVRLSGRLSLSNSRVELGDALPAPDLSTDFDLRLALREQELDIDGLHLEIDQAHRITLKAAIRDYLTHPQADLTLADAAFDIGKALGLARPWLPPVEASGTLALSNVHLTGEFPDFKPGDLALDSGRVDLLNFTADHAAGRVQGVNARLDLKQVKIKETAPVALEAAAHITAAQAEAGEARLGGFSQDIEIAAKNPLLTDVELAFATGVKSITVSRPELAGLSLPFQARGTLAGNWKEGDFPSIRVDYATGGAIQGSLSAGAKKLGRESFQLNKSVRLDLAAAQGLIPASLLAKLPGLEARGQAALAVEASGKLDQDFRPEHLAADTRIEVAGLDAALAEPALNLRRLTARVSFPARYDRATGARLGILRLEADAEDAQALGNWRVTKVHAETEIDAGEKPVALPLTEKLALVHRTVFKAAGVQSSQPPLRINGLGLDAALQVELTPEKEVENVKVDAALSLDEAAALGKISTGAIKTTLAAFAANRTLDRTRASVTLDLAAPAYQDGEWLLKPGPVHFTSSTRHNLKTGDIEIESARLGIPALLDFEASGLARNWGEEFDLKTSASNLRLAGIKPLLPPGLDETLGGFDLGGLARLDLAARGRRPEGFDRKRPEIPLDIHARVELADGLIDLPAKNLRIKSANLTTRLDTTGQKATLSGEAGLLVSTPQIGEQWLDPRLEFSYALDGADRLTIEKETLTVAGIGLSHALSGRIDGLKPFITGEAAAQAREILRRLDIALKTENRLQVAQALKGPALQPGEGIEARGAIDSHLDLRLKPADSIEIGGKVAFDHFNARLPGDLAIEEVNGVFPFNKKLWIEKPPPSQQETFRAARRGFFSQLRSFSSHKNILQADSLQWQSHRLSGLKMDLLLENDQLRAEKFIFDILGGALAGNFFLTQTAEGPQLNFFTEFAGLNFERLLPAVAGKPGAGKEAEIDGGLRLGLKLRKQQGGAISMDQIDAEIDITRIGAETLDRLLLYIDPEESKPAIVDTRAKLKLASPHQIRITLGNGNLNVEAWLKNKVLGDIIKAPELRRVPVSGLRQFKDLSERLQALTGLRDALAYLAARSLLFDEDGGLLLR